MKSAYWLGFLGWHSKSTISMVCEPIEVWRRIWALDTMPKAKHFLWCMAHSCAAVLQ